MSALCDFFRSCGFVEGVGACGFVEGVGACGFVEGVGARGFVAGGGKMGLFRGIGERKRGMSKHFDRAFLLMSGVFDGQAAFLSL